MQYRIIKTDNNNDSDTKNEFLLNFLTLLLNGQVLKELENLFFI